MRDYIAAAFQCVLVLLGLYLVAWGVHETMHLPEVRVNPAGECIQVIHPGRATAGSCDRIPERHVRIVVAGGAHG